MNQDQFSELVRKTLDSCRNLLVVKGGEYAGTQDRLANFKRGAALVGVTPLQVGLVYLSKHYDAVASYVRDPNRPASEPIEGRFDDLINYCLLMKALVQEQREAALPGLEVKETWFGHTTATGLTKAHADYQARVRNWVPPLRTNTGLEPMAEPPSPGTSAG